MPIKDVFPRNGRWDSVGLDCGSCIHLRNNKWPNVKRDLACGLHQMSLAIQLDGRNYMEGEWFCKNYTDNEQTNRDALEVFVAIQDQLDDNVLYRFSYSGSDLIEVPFEEIR